MLGKQLMVGLVISCLFLLVACGNTSKTSGTTGTDESSANSGSSNEGSGETGIHNHIIKAGIGLPEKHPEGQGLDKFKEIVEKKTDGKIKVKNYFNASLGDDQKMVGELQAGTLEVTIPSTSPMVGMVPQFGIFDFPFLFNNDKEAYAVLDGPIGQKILKKLPQHGLVGLSYWENGFRNLTNSVHPVNSVDDYKGLKIRVMQNEVYIDVFKKLGANPTPMPFSEVFTALDEGTIDGQENPLATILSNKFYEVQNYLSLDRHSYTPFVFLISKQFWDQLSDQEKKIIKDAAIKAGKYQRKLTREENKKALKELKAKGMKVSHFPNSEKEKARKMLQPVIDKYSKKFGQDLVNKMFNQLDKIRSQE